MGIRAQKWEVTLGHWDVMGIATTTTTTIEKSNSTTVLSVWGFLQFHKDVKTFFNGALTANYGH